MKHSGRDAHLHDGQDNALVECGRLEARLLERQVVVVVQLLVLVDVGDHSRQQQQVEKAAIADRNN